MSDLWDEMEKAAQDYAAIPTYLRPVITNPRPDTVPVTKTEVSVLFPTGARDTYWTSVEGAKRFADQRNAYEGNKAVVQTREVTEWVTVDE